MRQIRDFKCRDCGRSDERYIDDAVQWVECECGARAYRVISTPTVRLEGITGAFPGAHDKWARVREENARIKAKKERE